jgi:hypothetical protein
MATMIATERRLRMRRPGRELVVQNVCKLANSPRLQQAVAGKLRLDWSPEQIAGWLKRTRRAINYKPGLGGTPSRTRPSTARERPGRPALRHKPAPAHNKPAAAERNVTRELRQSALRR